MSHAAFVCNAIRAPLGRYAGALSGVHAYDLGAVPGLPLEVPGSTVNRLCGSQEFTLRLLS